MNIPEARRPLASRSTRWAAFLSTAAVRAGVSADGISILSLLVASGGAAALILLPRPWNLLACAAGIQLRLLCNLLDGMVAIEGGKQSAVGALYNEFPDRIADSLLLVALGYAALAPWLGWLAALLAALTAYVRATGGALGFAQDFRGPMAKPHRMAALTLACLVGAAEIRWNGTRYALQIGAIVIAAGAGLTCATRALALANRLRSR